VEREREREREERKKERNDGEGGQRAREGRVGKESESERAERDLKGPAYHTLNRAVIAKSKYTAVRLTSPRIIW